MKLSLLRLRLGRFWEPVQWALFFVLACVTAKIVGHFASHHHRIVEMSVVVLFIGLVSTLVYWLIAISSISRRSKKLRKEIKAITAKMRQDLLYQKDGEWYYRPGMEEKAEACSAERSSLIDQVKDLDSQEDQHLEVAKSIGRGIIWFPTYPFRLCARGFRWCRNKSGITFKVTVTPEPGDAPATVAEAFSQPNPNDERDLSSVGQGAVTGENAITTTPPNLDLQPSTQSIQPTAAAIEEAIPPSDQPSQERSAIPLRDADRTTTSKSEVPTAIRKEIEEMTQDRNQIAAGAEKSEAIQPPAENAGKGAGLDWLRKIVGDRDEAMAIIESGREVHREVERFIEERAGLVQKMLDASLEAAANRVLAGQSPSKALEHSARELDLATGALPVPTFLRKGGNGNGKHQHQPAEAIVLNASEAVAQ